MITLFKDPFFETFDKVFENSRFLSAPQTNIKKSDNEYKLFISIPGLTKEDLKITTKDGVLKISFERNEKTDNTYFVNNFVKSYYIPEDVKEKDIEGKVENGVLSIILPIDKKKTLERLISLN
jgi:HSP20 family protein